MNPENNSPGAGATRDLKCTLSADEFGAVQWAAKRAGKNHTAQPLGEFMRTALLEWVSLVMCQEMERRKPVPPDIARLIDEIDRKNARKS